MDNSRLSSKRISQPHLWMLPTTTEQPRWFYSEISNLRGKTPSRLHFLQGKYVSNKNKENKT